MKIIPILIISFFAVSLLGVLTHFWHKWFKTGVVLHVLSAINESVWEHMKLSFYPMVLVMVLQVLLTQIYYPGFWGCAAIVVLTATFLVPLLYYPVRKILGREVPAVSISLYFVCILLAFIVEYYLVMSSFNAINDTLAWVLLLMTFIAFAYFTYFPPKLPIFKDSIYKKYGEFKQPFDKKSKRVHPLKKW